MNRAQLLAKIDKAWTAFTDAVDGLPDEAMTAPGVVGDWSVKDILAHVTTWEEESLHHLPLILSGGRPPLYSVAYGGLDAFNALQHERRRDLPLDEVLRQLQETHRRLVDYVEAAPEDLLSRETRFRRRLRLDTYSHYPEHTRAILEWRERVRTPGRSSGD
jgi:hypothetical protein